MASIGVAPSAHQPQAPRPRYSAITMKRFFSATSMRRLIMLHTRQEPVAAKPEGFSRRTRTHSDTKSEQTHDDCGWLHEENGEQNVPGNRWSWDRRVRPPIVAQDECGNGHRQHHAGSENRNRNRGNERRCGGTRVFTLR